MPAGETWRGPDHGGSNLEAREAREKTRGQIRAFIEGLKGGSPGVANALLEYLTNLRTFYRSEKSGEIYSLTGEIPVLGGKTRAVTKTLVELYPKSKRVCVRSEPISVDRPPASGGSLPASEVRPGKGPEIIKFISENGSELAINPTGFFFIEAK